MTNMLGGILVLVPAFVVVYMLGYWRGEEHGYFTATKARWEREARDWDERHERIVHDFKED